MKRFAYFMLVAFASPPLFSQIVAPIPTRVRIAPEVAERLLIHKVDPACKPAGSVIEPRITGTVVLGIDIGIHGEVLKPTVISGPLLLRPVAINTVQQYQYKPYKLHGKPVEVETTVSVPFNLSSGCP
jgi:hypothetical protein